MSTDVIVRKANVGDSLTVVGGKYEVNVDGTSVLRDPITGLISSVAPSALPALPVPKVWLYRESHMGTFVDGNQFPCSHFVMVTVIDMPDVYLTNSTYRLQLELMRYKSRTHSRGVRKHGSTFVHPSHWVGGLQASAIRGTRGGSHNVGADRETEWPAAGLPHNAVIKLPMGNVFTTWFDIDQGIGNDATGGQQTVNFAHYRDGRRRLPVFYPNNRGTADMRQTGIFRLRWSYYDPVANERVSGPESSNILVYNRFSVSVPRWMLGLAVDPLIAGNDPNGGSHVLNPNLIAGKIEMIARIDARERI